MPALEAASLSKQFGGNFGQELAKASVAKLVGKTDDVASASPAGLGKL